MVKLGTANGGGGRGGWGNRSGIGGVPWPCHTPRGAPNSQPWAEGLQAGSMETTFLAQMETKSRMGVRKGGEAS